MQSSDEKKYPDKLFYRIHEVSEITGVKPYVLRYWETQFSELKPEKDARGQRRYRKSDIEFILQIKSLRYDAGYTIAGARQKLKHKNKKQLKIGSAVEAADEISYIKKQLAEIREEIGLLSYELRELLVLLEDDKK